MTVSLRGVETADLDAVFEFERDPESVRMAAFTAADPDDRVAFDAHWAKILANPTVVARTVLDNDRVAGTVASFVMEGEREVTYWIDRALWGRGIASAALALLLAEVTERPLFARAAADNAASIRVLERCGFTVIGDNVDFAAGRNADTREVIMRLDISAG